MRILAVIPARAGSKGIPNKNIRIINGRPMIYYVISNGLKSKLITDIVVTTDSPEVIQIAKQMGVNYKKRKAELSGDNITLDAVVFDAIPEGEEYDYIVTLQTTSPTLSVETLDKAIEYTISNGLDTVISAVNHPHLSWREQDGKKVPNYKKRLNRQYLPPYYLEAGAFVISKRSVVKPDSRIGKNLDLFEISDDEAIDIDNFADLQHAADILARKKIAIYVNGNNKRGMGHIYRALEIADELYCKPDIIFDKNQTDKKSFGRTTHNLIPVDGIGELYEKCKKQQYNLFINDILATNKKYMNGLRASLPGGAKIINFEDDGEGNSEADLVFNALYNESSSSKIKCGAKYYICAKTFLMYNPIAISSKVKDVLIAFGGADPQNYTDRLLRIISKQEYKNCHFKVVLGRAKKNVKSLLKYNNCENIDVLHDVKNMPELISTTDMAITSRGRTGYELALLGVPTIAMAQNAREEKHGFVNDDNGFSYIGLNPSDEVIEGNLRTYLNLSQESRQELQDLLLQHDLRNGRKHVMSLINSL
ncbi:cytidyltransferase [Candidatus Saccharibacteria bacterium]|nr:cytidyltransferase [Candidatus Saccharibacteria bacterium]